MKKVIVALILTNIFELAFPQSKYNDYGENQKKTVFLDNFSTNINNWWTGDNSDAFGKFENGVYIIEWRSNAYPIWNSWINIQFDPTKDFEIETTIVKLNRNNNLYGITFNRSKTGEYGFVINTFGSSVIFQDKQNQERRFIKPGGEDIPVEISSENANKLTVRKVKGELYFFINEKFIKSAEAIDLNASTVGFQLWYNTKIGVDVLRVSYLIADIYPPAITITNPDVSRGFIAVQNQKQIQVTGNVSDESGILEVLINNQEAYVDEKGNFSLVTNLAVGKNQFTVKATDIHNNSKAETFTITRTSEINGTRPTVITNENIETGKYYALIIGNSSYSDPKIPSLDNEPITDAESLFGILTQKYDFDKENVVLLKNSTYKQIIRAFDDFSKMISSEDNLLIFYAGHGYYDEKQGIGYWLPTDAEYGYTDAWLYNSVLVDNIKKIGSKHTLLISDACFSGSIFKTRALPKDSDVAYQKKYELKSRKAITSGTLKTVPNKSVFFKYLSDRLSNNPNKYLSASELFQQIEIPVSNNSPNIPQFGDIQNVGDEGGDFIFIRK